MNRNLRFAFRISLAVAAAMCAAGLHMMLTRSAPVVSAAVAGAQDQAPPDQGQDPAAVNMAPSGPSYTTEAPPSGQAGPPPGPDDQYYADQPTETTDQPPPPLPVYEQPPPPGDGYIWTPGYWAWGQPAITGFLAHGSRLPTWARCGHRAIGVFMAAVISSIPATGACTSASTAASTTVLDTSAMGTRAAIGTPGDSSTTEPTTTSTSESCITCTSTVFASAATTVFAETTVSATTMLLAKITVSATTMNIADTTISATTMLLAETTIHAPATVVDRAVSSPSRNRLKERHGASRLHPA